MLVAAAFVPAAPVMVPAIAAGAAAELAEFREAADAALRVILDAHPEVVVVLGEAPRSAPYAADVVMDLSAWGGDCVDLPGERLPLSLAMGSWWCERAGITGPRVAFGLEADDDVERCRTFGEALAERASRVAVVAVGGGSACRTAKAPGSFDERATAFDADLVETMGQADLDAVMAIDRLLATDLKVDGRAPWQVAAAMAAVRPADNGACVPVMHGTADPYGVLYLAASWRWES